MKSILHLTWLFFSCQLLLAQEANDSVRNKNWNLHAQATVIPQYHFPFSAAYTGMNSLLTEENAQTSFTATAYIGRRLWKGAAIYFNPEVAGGSGLSKALGVAGFVNGETFRIGSPQLKLYLARLFIEQRFALDKSVTYEEDELNQLQGKTPAKYISVRVGKYSLADFFDDNAYSHDPRTQFFNWSLMSNGAWDYPANTRGYTEGVVAEYHTPLFAVRASASALPTTANGPDLDLDFSRSLGLVVELEKSYFVKKRKATVRLLLVHNTTKMGNYREAVAQAPADPDITSVREYGHTKSGICLSWEQELTNTMGAFLRGGFNDGKNETWVFTEIDQTLSGGVVFKGEAWKRKADVLGVAFSLNGISEPHRDYLKAGGYGFIIGDGALTYGQELILETYYQLAFPKWHFSLSPDYQFVLNPAYNKDRGPVHVVGLRLHAEF